MIRFLSLFFLLVASVAWAYVPPSQFIIKTMIGKHEGFKGVKIKSEVVAFEANRPTDLRFKQITWYHPHTQTLKSYAMNEAGEQLYGIERKSNSFPAPDTLLFDSNMLQATRMLKERGLPIRSDDELMVLKDEEERRKSEISFLSRWKGAPAWVIGDKNKSVPQLWVEKDTFLPMRVLYQPPGGSGAVDVRFESHRFYREFPYPRMITLVKKNDEVVLRDDAIEVVVNPDSVEAKAMAEKQYGGFTDAGNAAPSALRELIRQYYESVR